MVYVYLNKYKNPHGGEDLLYVGIHSWEGVGIDPNYQGSSKLANYWGWVPFSIEILQVVEDKDFSIEGRLIEEFAERYGVFNHTYNAWTSKYREGCLINRQSSDCSHLWPKNELAPTLTDNALQKRAESRHKYLTSEEGIKSQRLKVTAKFLEAGRVAAATAEVRERAAKSHSVTMRSKRKRYQLSDGFEGDFKEVAEYLKMHPRTVSMWLRGKWDRPSKIFSKYTFIELG